jgi:hypothetical protein
MPSQVTELAKTLLTESAHEGAHVVVHEEMVDEATEFSEARTASTELAN